MKSPAPIPPPTLEGLNAVDQIKVTIMEAINENLAHRGWSTYRAYRELAEVGATFDEKTIYRVRNYDTRLTTVHWLVELAGQLGVEVKITVGSAKK